MIYYSKVSYALLIIVFIVFFGPLIPNYINDGFNSNMFLTEINFATTNPAAVRPMTSFN